MSAKKGIELKAVGQVDRRRVVDALLAKGGDLVLNSL